VVFATLVASAGAKELAGATLPDMLNVGGLYLESASKDPAAILSSDQAKAIRMQFLHNLSKSQLVDAFREGFEANAKDQADQKAAFDKMLAMVPDVKEGDTMTLAYSPGKDTSLAVDNKELGAFEGKGFADAVFSIWLGPKPPSEELKSVCWVEPPGLGTLGRHRKDRVRPRGLSAANLVACPRASGRASRLRR